MTKNDETGEVLPTTSFSQQLAFLSRGTLDFELTEGMAELVKAVRDTGKAGAITLTIKVSKLNGRDEDALKLAPSVSVKSPTLPAYESVMFSTADGDLLRADPRQRVLDLQQVPKKETGPLQKVPSGNSETAAQQ